MLFFLQYSNMSHSYNEGSASGEIWCKQSLLGKSIISSI